MSALEFMNQDGEWEKFPSDEDMKMLESMKSANPEQPMSPEIVTLCHLCNEPFPIESIVITGGSLKTGFTWSCPKCHAVSGIGRASGIK